MNDDNFIDQALKEHARLEGKDDQAFLDQLEEELDQHPVKNEKAISKKKRGSAFSAIAALFLITGTALGIFFLSEKMKERAADDVAILSVDEPQSMDIQESVQLSRGRIQSSTSPAPSGSISTVPLGGSVNGPVDFLVEGEGSRGRYPLATPAPMVLGSSESTRKVGSQGIIDAEEAPRFRSIPAVGRLFGDAKEVPSGEQYGQLIETSFLSPLKAPLSTFSTDVDTASYTNIRRHVQNNQAINPNAVRIEEMINYFDYSYPQPEGAHPFAVQSEVASCPWNENHRLVKIGLQGKSVNQGERKAANLVFLIDVSGSMSNADKLPLLVQSFQLLLKELNEDDRVSLVVYAGRQAVLLAPTAIDDSGRSQVAKALQNLSAGGSTHGSAGITTAYELARKAFITGGVNRVILATDGDFNVGVTNHEALLQLVKKQADGNISLTVLGFGQGNLNDALLENLTNKGDGNYYYLDSLREGRKVFQSGLTGTIQTIAKDVKIQVEFNPGKVAQYRLIGYGNRRLRDEDFANDKIDAGDIGAGHRVTALYEVIPVGAEQSALPSGLKYQKQEEAIVPKAKLIDSPELLTVKLRYKQPDGDVSTEMSEALIDENSQWQQASEDFRFASAVSLWGMLLRSSEHVGSGNPELVTQLALSGRGDDEKGERAEFLDLLRRWSTRR